MTYDDAVVAKVWESARAMMDHDPNVWRKDECGAWLYRDHYGSEESEYGWWIADTSLGHASSPENLRAFHHGNSFDIENGAPRCNVTADREGLAPEQSVVRPRNTRV